MGLTEPLIVYSILHKGDLGQCVYTHTQRETIPHMYVFSHFNKISL